ncbi:hypothetical protein IMG5_078320 [Ichthyophthirius multifiliis]|uniref:Transmembrane protein n=1 Tax=Ichthyophthirius multifiliis TaxID=5932 RepID=G0QQF9_ICHMU|nr:hypothetical protein IMG5_078320 [Ichthyophthirius multifiliis]EGR32544.1 hypothetical protein IMG5_078320 [Ichthyophthirius multifiliis]|eukprot:XP_004036530.1 hypothetical protein IMG5_078320 [Ichthyophthirius multifiliis]
MKSIQFLLLLILILYCDCNNQVITYEFDTTNFSESQGWIVNQNIRQSIQTCVNTFFGAIYTNGGEASVKKSYQSTVDQTNLNIQFELWALEVFNLQTIQININSKKIDFKASAVGLPATTGDQQPEQNVPGCLKSSPQYPIFIEAQIPYINKNFEFEIYSAYTNPYNFNWGIRKLKIIAQYKSDLCHASCNCDSGENPNGVCTSCIDPNSIMVQNIFCQCDISKNYVLVSKNPFKCETILTKPIEDLTKCDVELYKSIQNLRIVSYCMSNKENGNNFVLNQISYYWPKDTISNPCKETLHSSLFFQYQDGTYQLVDNKYLNYQQNYVTSIKVALIDIYQLAFSTKLLYDNVIYQVINMQIELGNIRQTLRVHKFMIIVYTSRDTVTTFQIDTTLQQTDKCMQGSDYCVIIADLDLHGSLCETSDCESFKNNNQYIVGDFLYTQVKFVDKTYKKDLVLNRVLFLGDDIVLDLTPLAKVTRNRKKSRLRILRDNGSGFINVELGLPYPSNNAQIQMNFNIYPDGANPYGQGDGFGDYDFTRNLQKIEETKMASTNIQIQVFKNNEELIQYNYQKNSQNINYENIQKQNSLFLNFFSLLFIIILFMY